MAYIQFGLIEASDYNNMVGGNPTTTPNTLNTVWATGGGQAGYGQISISNVAIGQRYIVILQFIITDQL